MQRFARFAKYPRVVSHLIRIGDQLIAAEASGEHGSWDGTLAFQPGKLKRLRSGNSFDHDPEIDNGSPAVVRSG